jgi:hypothetical protein
MLVINVKTFQHYQEHNPISETAAFTTLSFRLSIDTNLHVLAENENYNLHNNFMNKKYIFNSIQYSQCLLIIFEVYILFIFEC